MPYLAHRKCMPQMPEKKDNNNSMAFWNLKQKDYPKHRKVLALCCRIS